MEKKKKTRVLLPGGIQGLVHDLQTGKPIQQVKLDESLTPDPSHKGRRESPTTDASETVESPVAPSSVESPVAPSSVESPETPASVGSPETSASAASQPQGISSHSTPLPKGGGAGGEAAGALVGAPGLYSVPEPQEIVGRGRPQKVNTMKEYTIVKDDSADSWELFLDLAQQYKKGGGKLATIYIDEELKAVLDRMKYAGKEKLSTSAILSSIVARFIYDHAEKIKDILYRPLN